MDWEEIGPVDEFLTGSFARTLDLPQDEMVRFITTDTYPLFPDGEIDLNAGSQITRTRLGVMSNIRDHINLIEGRFPGIISTSTGEALEVMVSSQLAKNAGKGREEQGGNLQDLK